MGRNAADRSGTLGRAARGFPLLVGLFAVWFLSEAVKRHQI